MPMPVSVTASRTIARSSVDELDIRAHDDLAALGELHGIADEIHEHLTHAQRIAEQNVLHRRRRADDELDALVVGGTGKHARAFLEHLREIDGQLFERDLAGADLREIEQVVHDLQQDLRRRANRLRQMRLRRRQRRARQAAPSCRPRRSSACAARGSCDRGSRSSRAPLRRAGDCFPRARACAAALRPRGARAPEPSRGTSAGGGWIRCPTNARTASAYSA